MKKPQNDDERDQKGFYWLNNERYPSVTTVLKGYGKKFRAGDRAKIGSLVHYHIHSHYADRLLPAPCEMIWNISDQQVHDEIRRAVDMWQMLSLDNLEMIHVEETVYYRDGEEFDYMRFAGRPDQIFKYDGNIVLNDLKTGDFYYDYLLQLAAYVLAAEQWYDINIDEGWITQVDLNLNRNPESLPRITIITKLDLMHYCGLFLESLDHFARNFMKKDAR